MTSTSAEALRHVTLTGIRKANKDIVLRALEQHPGTISSELAILADVDVVETRRRLTDLKDEGLACQRHTGRSRTGRSEMRWWPCERQVGLL